MKKVMTVTRSGEDAFRKELKDKLFVLDLAHCELISVSYSINDFCVSALIIYEEKDQGE